MNDITITERLIKCGASVNYCDNTVSSLKMLKVMLFLRNQTNCSLQDRRSPLHVAAENGHMDILNMLITHGANVDTKYRVRNL